VLTCASTIYGVVSPQLMVPSLTKEVMVDDRLVTMQVRGLRLLRFSTA
jgi:hypothetical protein